MCPLAPVFDHPWDLSPHDAIELQRTLRTRLVTQPLDLDAVKLVAGVDVGFRNELAHAAAVVLDFPSLQPAEQSIVDLPIPFPYVPGLLSFRETPAILATLTQLKSTPDVLICDGQGIAHPRRFGIACHLGVLLDIPSLGCAKSILVGRHAPLDEAAGSTTDLVHHGEVIGCVVRTRQAVKPVFISVGNRIDLPSAVRLALACTGGYRLPEPTRLADRLASRKGSIGLDKE